MSAEQDAAAAVVHKISAAPHLGVSEEDAAILLAAPQRTLMMEKLLAIHYNATQDFENALEKAELIFFHEQTAEGAKNIALLLRRLNRHDEGIAFASAHEELFDPIVYQDTLCMLHRSNNDIPGAIRHGNKALELKDSASPEAVKLEPKTRPFDPARPERNIIAFSLFGKQARYILGARTNATVARYLYPGWTVRIYVDDSVPDEGLKMLTAEGAKVLKVNPDWPAAQYGLFWRFLVEDDEDVDFYLVRDADSVMNIKERAAVEDWLVSGRAFHIMRDWPAHSELILAGMWGAHRGNLGCMAEQVYEHVKNAPPRLNDVSTDQLFLRTRIWPVARQDVLVHDAHFSHLGTQPYRDEFKLPGNMHIGQNDWVNRGPVRTPGA